MDANLLNLGTSTTGSSLANTPPSGNTGQPSAQGTVSFAGIFSNLQIPAERQDLAAWPQGLQMPSLVTQALGEGLSVITPDAPSPAQDSLLAFARSQGLDEQAIAALWQSPSGSVPVPGIAPGSLQTALPVPPQAALGAPTPAPPPDLAAMGALLGLAHGAGVATSTTPPVQVKVLNAELADSEFVMANPYPAPAMLFVPPAWATPAAPKAPEQAAAPATEVANPSLQALLRNTGSATANASASNSASLLAPGIPQATVPSSTPAATSTAAPVSPAATSTVPPVSPAASPSAPEVTPAALIAMQVVAMAEPHALTPNAPSDGEIPAATDDAQRLTLQNALLPREWRLTRQAPQAANTEATAANPIVTTAHPPQREPELLDLEAELVSILAQASTDVTSVPAPATSTGAAQGAAIASATTATPATVQHGANATTPTPPPVISGFQLKADHYQQLADRMGQALAQRLQQQIERGEWSMQLRLNPAELGRIDVQLDMHRGGLDAMFQTDNPLTRDLIQQGSGRLKEGLAQSGMTVASVWVNSDGSRQSGGNPTPQQQQQRRSANPQAPVASASGTPAPNSPVGDQGWDMLA